MKLVICRSNVNPRGLADSDVRVGALYEVVSDPVDSEAGEFITVHLLNEHGRGRDLTKPKSMFRLVGQAHLDTMLLCLSKTEVAALLLAMSRAVDYVDKLAWTEEKTEAARSLFLLCELIDKGIKNGCTV